MSVDHCAKVIWNYMNIRQELRKADAVFVLGSTDDRIAQYGAKLFLQGYGDWLIISGGIAHKNDLLRTSWGEKTEAAHFASIAEACGVPRQKMLLEERAKNTGDNMKLAYQLIQKKNLPIKSFVVVQKPFMLRRTYATFMKQWPGVEKDFIVTGPNVTFEEYFDEVNNKDRVINVMVGDLQRIKEYPKLGFQIEQEIPREVWDAYEKLVAAGYTKHLI